MKQKKIVFKIAGIWLAIIVLVVFSISLNEISSPITLITFPEVPKEDTPVLVIFTLKNFGITSMPSTYELFANGEKVLEGEAMLSALSSKSYSYLYPYPIKLGEQVTFVLRAKTPTESYEKIIAVPPYHPHVWTSFVSFASFSTSMAGVTSSMGVSSTTTTTITSMAYYSSAFGNNHAINVGVIFSAVLIAVLIHVEVTEPYTNAIHVLGRLRRRFSKVSAILFIIFMAMVFTQIAMILSWV
jgi:hypothetical protein